MRRESENQKRKRRNGRLSSDGCGEVPEWRQSKLTEKGDNKDKTQL